MFPPSAFSCLVEPERLLMHLPAAALALLLSASAVAASPLRLASSVAVAAATGSAATARPQLGGGVMAPFGPLEHGGVLDGPGAIKFEGRAHWEAWAWTQNPYAACNCTAGNEIRCSDGSAGQCPDAEVCYATAPFYRGADVSSYCRRRGTAATSLAEDTVVFAGTATSVARVERSLHENFPREPFQCFPEYTVCEHPENGIPTGGPESAVRELCIYEISCTAYYGDDARGWWWYTSVCNVQHQNLSTFTMIDPATNNASILNPAHPVPYHACRIVRPRRPPDPCLMPVRSHPQDDIPRTPFFCPDGCVTVSCQNHGPPKGYAPVPSTPWNLSLIHISEPTRPY